MQNLAAGLCHTNSRQAKSADAVSLSALVGSRW